jgi:hypothetical protein
MSMNYIKPDGSKDTANGQITMASLGKLLKSISETGAWKLKGIGDVTVQSIKVTGPNGMTINASLGKGAATPAAGATPAAKPSKPAGSKTVVKPPPTPATAALPGAKPVTMAPPAGKTP